MKNKKFFECEGIEINPKPGTSSHEMLEMVVREGERVLVIEALRSRKIAGGDFLPAKIWVKGGEKPIWSFQELKSLGFDGLAKLFRLESENKSHVDLIGLLNRSERIVAVMPLSALGKSQTVRTEQYGLVCLGGYELQELAQLKRQLSGQERIGYVSTAAEDALMKELSAIKEADAKAARAAREQEERDKEAARRAAREAKQAEIRSRERVAVFTYKGARLSGIPVTKDEWQALGNGQHAVLVESYNIETKEPGKPIEHFRVIKSGGGRLSKAEVTTGLSYELPKTGAVPMSFKIFRLDDKLATLPVVDRKQLEEMKKTMNSGTRVAVPEGENFMIFSLEKGKTLPLGVFPGL